MAVTADQNQVAYIFKRRYTDKQVTEVVMRDHPTWYRLQKTGGFDGPGLWYPITYGNPQGISGTFADAQSGAEVMKGVQLQALRRKKYGVILLDGEAMAAARGNKGSFYDLVTKTTDAALEEMGDSLAFDLQRDGTGIRGQISAIAGNIVTLKNPTDARNLKVGMTIGGSTGATGLVGVRGNFPKVTAVSRQAGQFTVDAIGAFQVNDYVFRKGDPGTCMEGFETCTPLVAPVAGDSFRTIDRSVDVEALAGSRDADTTKLIEDAFGDMAVQISTIGKKIREGALYSTNFHSIVKRSNAKVEYDNPGGTADIGFEYITIHTAAGAVRLYSDPDVAVDRGRGFLPDAHRYHHLDEVVHVIRDDGRPSMRSVGSDSIEIRARSMGNYLQDDTSPHGVIQIVAG